MNWEMRNEHRILLEKRPREWLFGICRHKSENIIKLGSKDSETPEVVLRRIQ
jgi:hypothetical protein